MVNLDFIICANSSDPFFKWFGKWYYVLADVYLGFGSYLVRLVFVFLAYYSKRLVMMAMGKDHTEEKYENVKVRKINAKKQKED